MLSFINNKKIKLTVVVITIFLFTFSSTVYAGKVQIPKDKEISVRFSTNIKISSGVLAESIPILFHLEEPIEIGGIVIVEKGAEGKAIVKESVKSSKGGKPGKLVLEFVELTPKGDYNTIDDSKIKLTGTVTAEGKGKKLLSYLLIFGLFTGIGFAFFLEYLDQSVKNPEDIERHFNLPVLGVVYDTSKDSDGGAWRHRTQNRSWYNEGAGQYRGARKEFPAVAVQRNKLRH